MKLKDNTILITGGSAGIGLAFAKKFVELGNTVIITGRKQDKLDEAKASVPELHTIQCDAGSVDAVAKLRAQVEAEHPKLNVLMNNAGVFLYKNLTTPASDLSGLTVELDINVAGPIRTISVLIDTLKANRGTILNVSSGLAYVPLQCAPVYCATKAALHSYTMSLRQQLKAHNVEVIELMPPAVKTDLTAELDGTEGFKLMTTNELVTATVNGLSAGDEEIRPGQANQLHWMSRIAPGFINAQLEKGAASLVPKSE